MRGIKLIFNEVLLPFSFKLLKQLLLLLSDMLGKLLGYPVYWEHGRLNTLVDITLTIRRRQNDHARETFLGETVYAVVVVFVIHPKIVILCQLCFSLPHRPRLHAQLNGWVIKYHVQGQLEHSSEESLEIISTDVVLELFQGPIPQAYNLFALRPVHFEQEFVDLGVRVLENLEAVLLEHWLQLLLKVLNYLLLLLGAWDRFNKVHPLSDV